MNQAHIVESGFVWKQGDFGFNIEIEVLDFDTTGATPQIIFRKSTGAVEATQISVAGNKFTYAIRGTELDTPGPCVCDLKLKDSTTKRVSTASFKYFVIPDTMDGLNQQASSYSDTIEQLLADVVHLSDTPGLVKNDGTINQTIESDVTNLKKDVTRIESNDTSNEIQLNNILKAKLGSVSIPFESGYVDINNNAFRYLNNSSRVRTVEGYTIHLNAGDKVGLTDYTGKRFNHYRYDDTTETYITGSWRTSDLNIKASTAGTYVFMLAYDPDATVEKFDDLSKFFFCEFANSEIKQINSGLSAKNEMMQSINDNVLGIGNLTGNAKLHFLLGDIQISSGVLIYKNSTTRIRTAQDFTIYLKTGDKIGLTSYTGNRYLPYRKNPSTGLWQSYGWKTADTTISSSSEGEYAFMISNDPEATISDLNALAGLFFVNISNDIIGSMQNNIDKGNLVNKIQDIRNEQATGILPSYFESGYVNYNDSGFVYSNNINRIRTLQGVTIHLYAGDYIGMTDYTDLRWIAYRYDTTTETYKSSGWQTHDKSLQRAEEGDYVFMIGHPVDAPITDIYSISKKFFIRRSNNPVRLKLISFNIGHFAYGGGTQTGGVYERYGIPTEVYDDRLKNWKNFFSSAAADIAFIQEYSRCLDRVSGEPDTEGEVDTNDNLFSYLYPYNIMLRSSGGGFIDNCLFSTYQLIDWNLINLGSVENRSSVWADYAKIFLNGKLITLINLHLYAGSTSAEKRAEEIDDLLDIIDSDKYVIICGDFNIHADSELQPFIEAGYTVANTSGYFGDVPTYNSRISSLSNADETAGQSWNATDEAAGTDYYFDNIITTPNIKIQKFEPQYSWYEKLTSDHVGIITELVIE